MSYWRLAAWRVRDPAETRRRKRPVIDVDKWLVVIALMVILKITNSMAASWAWANTIGVIVGWAVMDIIFWIFGRVFHRK